MEKHGVSFAVAMTVFGDPLELTIPDPYHSQSELRYLSIGLSAAGRLRVVAYIERQGLARIVMPDNFQARMNFIIEQQAQFTVDIQIDTVDKLARRSGP